MTHRRFIKQVLLAACFASIPMAANAKEPEHYFYPKYKWSAKNVASSASCMLHNQLNNGYKITITGTPHALENIAIDFEQDIFEAGLKYEVQYSIPGFDRALLPTKAINGSKLQSDMSANAAFAAALKNANVLDVQIRNNQFRIYLTGLQAALPNLNTCTNNFDKTTVTTAAVSPAPPPIKEDASFVPPEVPAQDGLAPPPPLDKPEPREKYTHKLAQQMKDDSAKYLPEEDAAKPVKSETLAPVPAPAEMPAPTDKKQIAEPDLSAHKTPAMKVTHTKHEPIVADFTGKAPEAEVKVAAVETQKIAAPKPSIKPTAPAANPAAPSADVAELQARITKLQQENRLLSDELKATLQDAKDERMNIAGGNWNLEQATMKYNEAERQVMRLGRQLQTHKAACEAEKKELENMLFDPKVTNQQQLAKLAELERQLEQAKDNMYRQQRQYEERIKLLEQQLNTKF